MKIITTNANLDRLVLWLDEVVLFSSNGDQATATKEAAAAITALRERIRELEAEIESMIESDCDKVMAMTNEQVAALSVVHGSSSDIDALKGEIAIVKAQLHIAEKRIRELEAAPTDAEVEAMARWHESCGTPRDPECAAMLRSLSRQVAAKDADLKLFQEAAQLNPTDPMANACRTALRRAERAEAERDAKDAQLTSCYERMNNAERERDALRAEVAGLRERCAKQRRELRRLNKTLGPYWQGFRTGLAMESTCKLRGIMNARFGHKAVHEAEHAAIDAALDGKAEKSPAEAGPGAPKDGDGEVGSRR